MNPNSPKLPPQDLPDFDSDLENDALWSLLQETSPTEISPRFTQDTLRRLRLDRETTKTAWWKKLLSPKPLIATAATALAAVAIVISLPNASESGDQQPIVTAPEPSDDWQQLEDTLAKELLSGAAEDPSLLSDEEILTLLF